MRRIIIAPMATPSRNNGVARTVRIASLLADRDLEIGNPFQLLRLKVMQRESFAGRASRVRRAMADR